MSERKKYKLKDLQKKIIGGGTPSKEISDYWNGDINWASVKDIKDDMYFLYDTEDKITSDGLNRSSSNLIPKNSILLATRIGVGKCCINKIDTAINQDLKAIHCNNDLCHSYYLLYLLKTLKDYFELIGHGTTVKGIRLEQLLDIEFFIPDVLTQKKIAGVLVVYDELIENNTRRIKILEEMAQSLYREWFVNFKFPGHEKVKLVDSPLGMIPEGWEVKNLGQVALFQNNTTDAGEHLSDCVYLPIECIPRKSLAIGETQSWKEAQSSLHLFDSGDILFGAMRPYFHKVVIAPFKGVTRKTCFVFKSLLPEYHAFTALTLFQESTVSFANAHSKGSTIPYAAWSQSMDSMPVIFPSKLQANQFQDAVGPMLDRIGKMFFQNTNLRQTRDLLLPRLISGELDVSGLDIDTSILDLQ
jgi:type I restriction enzyme S subunit